MIKKTIISTMVLGLVIASSAVMSEAEEPLYDEAGNLILDTEQEGYKDLSTVAPAEPVVPSTPVAEVPVDTTIILDPVPTTPVESNPTTPVEPVVEKVEPEFEFGVMTPEAASYMVGGTEDVKTEGSKPITSVVPDNTEGMPAGVWSFNKANNNITFNKSKLENVASGVYAFTVTYDDGFTSSFELTVVGEPTLEDYWQQNIQVFNKDVRSNTHKDLELISSTTTLKVSSITIGDLTIPTSQYTIREGTIIISKTFLSSLEATSRGRITVAYGKSHSIDFSLEITDEVEAVNTAEAIDC